MPLRIAHETPVTYDHRKQEAILAARKGRWQDALAMADACLQERADDWEVVSLRAAALYRVGQVEAAADLMRQGIANAPAARDFHHNLAFLLVDTGKPLEAAPHALAAFAETPGSADIRRTVERCRHELIRQTRKLRRAGSTATPEMRQAMTDLDRALTGTAASAGPRLAGDPRISVVMIVKDEERYLADCLRSVAGVADEIVVVDTGSTDNTREIARQFGALVVDHPWRDDFSDARNVSLAHATGDWALWIDADERLMPEAAAELRNLVRSAPAKVGAYMVGIRNYLTAQGKSDIFWHRACRLFRRVPEARFEGRVHEQNTRGMEAAGFVVMASDLQLDHLGYTKSMMDERNKHERFITMLHQEIDENPNGEYRHFQMFNLGNAYYILGDMENARVWFERSAENTRPEHDYTAMLFVQWATALYRTHRPVEALAVCDRADAAGVRHPGLAFSRGHAHLQLHDFAAARTQFEHALKEGRALQTVDVGDAGTFTYKASFGLALADMAEGRHADCVRHSQDALALAPEFAEARYTLAHGLWRTGKLVEARDEYESLLAAEPDHDPGASDYTYLLEEIGDLDAAAPRLRALAARSSGSADTWARLARCHDGLARHDEARDAWTITRRLLPGNAGVCVNLGRSCAAMGDYAAALEAYAEAADADPDCANAFFNAADAAYQLGRYSDAANMLHQALTLEPGSAGGFFVLGNCYFQTADYGAARMAYQAALERDPSHAAARANLDLVGEMLQAA